MSHTATCEADGHTDSDIDDRDIDDRDMDGPGSPPPALPAARPAGASPQRRRGRLVALPEVRWAALALATFVLAAAGRASGVAQGVQAVLLVVCYAAGGWGPAVDGLRALRDKDLDVDLLMVVAALGAAAIGEEMDGALLIVIFATSGALEAAATMRTRDAVASLLTLAPERATLLVDGDEVEVDAGHLKPGDLILVRPGERVTGDGVVVAGTSDVDEATMTGEAMPVPKSQGHRVLAGTLNGSGALRVRVETSAEESVVARIAAMVSEASETKAATQLFIDRVEQRYSVGVVAVTVGLLVLPLAAGSNLDSTLLRAMTFMIVASPCALVLATMPPLLSAIANAGRHGVLIKSAVVMEQLGHVDVVALDKTGTLTEGEPHVTRIVTAPGTSYDEQGVLALAAAVELDSEHPLARAIVAAALRRNLPLAKVSSFQSQAGFGVSAVIDGRSVVVSRPHHTPDTSRSELAREADHLALKGQTVVVVEVDGTPVGVIGLEDRVRGGAAKAVAHLAKVTARPPVMVTGDNEGAGQRVATQVGIADVRCGLLPDQKVAAIGALGIDGSQVMMIGDGVNDSPALAAASTGVALGRRGSDLAVETADVIIVGDELAKVAPTIQLSRRARRVVNQNLAIASTVIVVLSAIDVFGHLPLALGVAGHEGSTVVVALNGLRLLSRRSWRRDT